MVPRNTRPQLRPTSFHFLRQPFSFKCFPSFNAFIDVIRPGYNRKQPEPDHPEAVPQLARVPEDLQLPSAG